MKMSDAEIIKAFTICANQGVCKDCPFDDLGGVERCMHALLLNTLDLINRLKAENEDLKRDTIPKLQNSLERANKYGIETDKENERLKAEIERLNEYISRCESGEEYWVKCLIERPNEVIKEFAERLNKEAEDVEVDQEGDFVFAKDDIYNTVAEWCKETTDNLLKEMG